jgi:hypothetical protein
MVASLITNKFLEEKKKSLVKDIEKSNTKIHDISGKSITQYILNFIF